MTSIEESAFSGCRRLKTLTLSENLKMIKVSAFSGCSSLTELVIPATVELIYTKAFEGCNALKSVTCLATTPPTAFDQTFSKYDIPLIVPTEAINDYQGALECE